MLERIGTIRNPLTIIAMFAGLAEISGTGILPFISNENQHLFVIFLMLFPILLIILFFLTLNFNHHVLYAPSDFKDEANYFKNLKSISPAERIIKLEDDVKRVESSYAREGVSRVFTTDLQAINKPKMADSNILTGKHRHIVGLKERVILAERLVADRLSKEFGQNVTPDVRVDFKSGGGVIYDGAINSVDRFIAIDINYIAAAEKYDQERGVALAIRTLSIAEESYQYLPDFVKSKFMLIIAFVYDRKSDSDKTVMENLSAKINKKILFPFEVRSFSLDFFEDESVEITSDANSDR